MALYAIGDLHLSLGADKPMDVFGGPWENYVEKIKLGFSSLHDDDVCVPQARSPQSTQTSSSCRDEKPSLIFST